jgi:polysaccharide biosynthesis protein PslH
MKPSHGLDLLIASNEPPDPFGNAAGRWYYVLAKGLSDRGHRVRWLSSFNDGRSAQRARVMLAGCDIDLRLYPRQRRSWLHQKVATIRRPYGHFISGDFARDMETEKRRGYDVLHLEQTAAGWLGLGASRALLSVHWLATDLAADGRSVRSHMSKLLLTHVEQRIIPQYEHVRLLTERDAAAVRPLHPSGRLSVAPLAIDPSLYAVQTSDATTPIVGLIGSLNWSPTYAAAVRLLTVIWPRIKSTVPSARLIVAGWNARRVLGSAFDDECVTILEDVPDALAVLRTMSVFAFPARDSSGIKVKVLEAMASGIPVVTTTAGVSGIDAVDGVHACISDDDDVFADRVCELLRSRDRRAEISGAARRLVEEKYSPAPMLARMEALYSTILV